MFERRLKYILFTFLKARNSVGGLYKTTEKPFTSNYNLKERKKPDKILNFGVRDVKFMCNGAFAKPT